MRRLLLLALFVSACAGASSDQVPGALQGDWLRDDRVEGRDDIPEVMISIEPDAYVMDGVRLELVDIRRDGEATMASAIHDVKVDTAGFDLGWRVEHSFAWTLRNDSLVEQHGTVAIFPDQPDNPIETSIENVYARP